MLWIRGLLFTVLIPGTVGGLVPFWLIGARPLAGGAWHMGWIAFIVGAGIFLTCLLSFLSAGGTPAPFFARSLRKIVGEEPAKLVRAGLYRFSRNPMYVGVLLAIFGQAILFASTTVALYGFCGWILMHLVVVLVEEPHLRATQGQSYEDYCRRVPRWLGFPR